MRKVAIVALVLTLASVLMTAFPKNEPQTRTLTGQVTDRADTPLSGAVVYLQNSRTQAVKTFITGQDGNYRFSALSPNVDYQVYAEYKGHRSDSKTLSSFDSRNNVVLHLKVNLRK